MSWPSAPGCRPARCATTSSEASSPPFRPRDTAYGPEHLTRLKAIRALQKRFLPLDAIERELQHRSSTELERMAADDAPETVFASPRVPPAALPLAAEPPLTYATPPEPARWERFELSPGLELHVS